MKKRIAQIAAALVCLIAAFELFGGAWAGLNWQDTWSIEGSSPARPTLRAMNVRLEVSSVTGHGDLAEEIKEAVDGCTSGALDAPHVAATGDIELEVTAFDRGGWNPFSKTGMISYVAHFKILPEKGDSEPAWAGSITAESTVTGSGWLSRKGMSRHLVWRLKKTVLRAVRGGIQREVGQPGKREK